MFCSPNTIARVGHSKNIVSVSPRMRNMGARPSTPGPRYTAIVSKGFESRRSRQGRFMLHEARRSVDPKVEVPTLSKQRSRGHCAPDISAQGVAAARARVSA